MLAGTLRIGQLLVLHLIVAGEEVWKQREKSVFWRRYAARVSITVAAEVADMDRTWRANMVCICRWNNASERDDCQVMLAIAVFQFLFRFCTSHRICLYTSTILQQPVTDSY